MDLPRFHSGNLGPLGFEQINEMMRRLDAVLPIIERQSSTVDSPGYAMSALLPVYARRGDGENADRYSWKAIIIRGADTADPDSIVLEDDPDREEIEAGATFREGQADGDSYAISIDSRFDEGFAFLIPYRRQDGVRSFLLFPIHSNRNIAIIDSVGESDAIEIRAAGGGSFLNAPLYVYQASELVFGSDQGEVYLEKRGPFALHDFSLHNLNAPAVPEGTQLIPRPLDANTVVEYSTAIAGDAAPFHYITGLPRFDVVCGEVQFADEERGILSRATTG